MTDDPTQDEIREAVRQHAEDFGISVEELLAEMEQLRPEVEARMAEEARLAAMTPAQRRAHLSWIERRKKPYATAMFQGNPCKRGHVGKRYVSTGKCVDCHTEWNAARAQRDREAKLKAKGVDVDGLKSLAIEEAAKMGFDITTPEGQAALSKAVKNKERADARAEKAETREEKRERWRAEAEATRAKPGYIRPPWLDPKG